MIIALFIIAALASVPIAATVVVSIASRREDAAWSLGGPAPGMVQAAARRLLDFHTEDPAWPVPKSYSPVRPTTPALRSVGHGPVEQGTFADQVRSTVTDMPESPAASSASIRTAA